MNEPPEPAVPVEVQPGMLADWPLPLPSNDCDKEARGRLLIVGGSSETPGAVLLAANAALRAGAGKVAIATAQEVALPLALAIPEARVIGLPVTPDGGLDPNAVPLLESVCHKIDAVLIGPGTKDEAATAALVRAILPRLPGIPVVLDAYAMSMVGQQAVAASAARPGSGAAAAESCFAEGSDLPLADTVLPGARDAAILEAIRFAQPVLLTPHAGEMAHLVGIDKATVQDDPVRAAMLAARRWNAIVALKGAETVIASPAGGLWRHAGGNAGLAASGSGDVLAGIIAGLAARGATLEQACVWGVALHGEAGERLARRVSLLGYLARELSAEIPLLMAAFGRTGEHAGPE